MLKHSKLSRGPLRAYTALAAAAGTIAAMVLVAAAGPVQAASAVPHGGGAAPAARSAQARTGPAVRSGPKVLKRPGRQAEPAKHAAPDARRVCAAPKRGYAACMALVRTNVPGHRGMFAAGTTPSGYGPADLQSAYKLPSATAGSGRTVAIVDAYDDPNAEADLQLYRAQYGLPVCDTANGCFEKVNQEGQQGGYPAGDANWAVEESLDMDMVSATCPNCHIILVEANSASDGDLNAAEDEAVALGALYVSNSWASCEYPSETQDDQYFNHPGVVITAAGGDNGYDNYTQGCTVPNYPASSQYVTAVGGTSLTQDSSVPRGWAETVWSGTGSGCSAYEPKPSWQTDSGCANRTTNDVSAVADPSTGVALYDSYSEGGWLVVGGTSVATPIIASTYALAGTPVAGTYPSSYPYTLPSALNDVTSGSNSPTGCTPSYLCTAGPGYDGPTGLGTPEGVAAFSSAPHGEISGQVTSKATGDPVAGATVATTQGYTATADSSGDYDLYVPVGSYDLTARAFGYKRATATGVAVGNGQTVTENFALATARTATLSGTVTDGSGHKWPLYAKISIGGDPDGPVYTNPYTGAYSVSLPEHGTYQLQVTPVSAGYTARDLSVRIGDASKVKNIKILVDPSSCSAPGYGFKQHGSTETFTGWSGTTPQDGWTVTDNQGNGQTWDFSNPGGLTPPSGGDADFASVDSVYYGAGHAQDTSLVSPVENLSGVTSPVITFDTYIYGIENYGLTMNLDLSLDGGQTWTTVYDPASGPIDQLVGIPVPQAAGQPDVQFRFHYTSGDAGGGWWEVDNVSVASCAATRGGLVAGQVTDANTGDAVDGATVASTANPSETATTADSPGAGDGFYELFAPGTGGQQFTATDGGYAPDAQTVDAAVNAVTRQDFALQAGHLTVSASSLSATVPLGGAATRKVTLTNDGAEPVRVGGIGEQNDGFTPMGGQAAARAAKGVPLQRIKGHFTPRPFTRPPARPAAAARSRAALGHPSPDDSPWTGIANYPAPVSGNAVAFNDSDGKVYSVGGFNPETGDQTNAGYVYDPTAQQWAPIAGAPVATQLSVAAFSGGSMYLIGGTVEFPEIASSASVYAYHPATNTWSQVASLPQGVTEASVAVLDGQIYSIGGCVVDLSSLTCPGTAAVQRYDPATNTWTELAGYPVTVAQAACAGINGEVVCAGGNTSGDGGGTSLASTYSYDPASNTWSQGADMPYTSWGADYAGANGDLQVIAGVNDGHLTNQAEQYDPVADTWTALPNASTAEYDGGGACGIYQIGGIADSAYDETDLASVLPGYDQCGGASVPWLSLPGGSGGFTLAPGQSVTVTVTMNASAVTQPGTYAAKLSVSTDTPYPDLWVGVSMQVSPPKSWGKIAGTVTSAATGKPVAGATVQICTQYDKATGGCGQVSYTLTTDADGNWQLWLAQGYNPLQVSAAMDGYQPQARIVKITKGTVTTVSFALTPS